MPDDHEVKQMRLSEAIRLGATMGPQTFGRFRKGDSTCALGAAAEAIGFRDAEDVSLSRLWPVIDILNRAACPQCGDEVTVSWIITHLNDAHCWTRERIADYVELHEAMPAEEQSTLIEAGVTHE